MPKETVQEAWILPMAVPRTWGWHWLCHSQIWSGGFSAGLGFVSSLLTGQADSDADQHKYWFTIVGSWTWCPPSPFYTRVWNIWPNLSCWHRRKRKQYSSSDESCAFPQRFLRISCRKYLFWCFKFKIPETILHPSPVWALRWHEKCLGGNCTDRNVCNLIFHKTFP